MNAILRKRRYRRWGFVGGFVFVVGCSLVVPAIFEEHVRELLHLLALAGLCAGVVTVTAVWLRLTAPRPGLTQGLLAGAAWGVVFVALAVVALIWILVSNTA